MSRSLKLTRPSSRRLILDSEARIRYPAASRVSPRASRKRRNCAPTKIRRTVGPPAEGSGVGTVCAPLLTLRSDLGLMARPRSPTATLWSVCHLDDHFEQSQGPNVNVGSGGLNLC